MVLEDRLAIAVRGKYFSKNPEEVALIRNRQQKLKEKQISDL